MSADGGDAVQIVQLPFSKFVGKDRSPGDLKGSLQAALGSPNILIHGFDEIPGMEQSGFALYTSPGHYQTTYSPPISCGQMANELIRFIPKCRYPKPSSAEMPESRKGWEIRHTDGRVPPVIAWTAWV